MSDVSSKAPKLYKNPHRKESEPSVGHYTPQYQTMGLTPKKIGGNELVGNVMIINNKPKENDNPRTRVPTIRQQPYAEYAEPAPDTRINTIPNVGNSMDHTWSGVDGELIDDLEVDSDTEMIDNNMMETDELEVTDEGMLNPAFHFKGSSDENLDTDINYEGDGFEFFLGIAEGQYILLIDGSVVAVGGKDEIVGLASLLVFGEHDICEGNPIPVDNISILKKMPIKVGIFLE